MHALKPRVSLTGWSCSADGSLMGFLMSFLEGSCSAVYCDGSTSTADCVCFSIRCRSYYACVRATAAASSASMSGAGMLSSLWLCSWSSQIYRWPRLIIGLIFTCETVYFGDKAVAKYNLPLGTSSNGKLKLLYERNCMWPVCISA